MSIGDLTVYDETQGNLSGSVGPANTVREPDTHDVAPLEVKPPYLLEVLSTLRRRWWLVLLVALLFTGAAVGFDLWRTPVYEASATLLVDQEPVQPDQQAASSSSPSDLKSSTPEQAPKKQATPEKATQTMAEALPSRPVAREVIETHGLQTSPEELIKNLNVKQSKNTQFIQLTYKDTDPERARDVANSLGTVASSQISQAGGASTSSIKTIVWEYAEVPRTPVSPRPVRDGLLAAGMGIMLGVGLAFLLGYLDDTRRLPKGVT